MRRIIVLLHLLAALPALSAQTVAFHTDRDFYAAGEVVRLRAYLPIPVPPVLRLDVYAPSGERIDYFFVQTDPTSGTADAYYRWDYRLPTGYYRMQLHALRADTEEVVDLATLRLSVYALDDRRAEPDLAPVEIAEYPSAQALALTVGDGQLAVDGLPSGTAYSVSVLQREAGGTDMNVSLHATADPAEPPPAAGYRDTLFYTGIVRRPDDEQPAAVNLLPFFEVNTLRTYFSKSDEEGQFLLTLPPFEGTGLVQARDVTDNDLRATLTEPRLPALSERPPLTEAVLRYLDLSYRRRKIFQLYATVETPIRVEPATPELLPLQPNQSYQVQDYKTFPDMLTFFREVASELRYRRRRGKLTARLYNAPNQRFFTRPPLFIVNGHLTQDVDYIARIRPSEVERLDIFYNNRELRRDFPALGGGGVVRIELLRGLTSDFPATDRANVLPVLGLQPPADFDQPGNQNTPPPRINPLLLWDSGRTEGGPLRIVLPESDDGGDYRVEVVARTPGGVLRRGTATYTITSSAR